MQIDTSTLPAIGTRIDYRGDMANPSDHGYVVSHQPADRFSPETCTVILDDGREWKQMQASQFGTDRLSRWRIVEGQEGTPEVILGRIRAVETARRAAADAKATAQAEHARLVAIGRDVAARLIPADCQALIVADLMKDESDPYSDYFHSSRTGTVVLAVSKHTRDLFPEMRKAARRFKPTAQLAVDGVENRQKWSMGAGYFLSTTEHSRSGWIVRKARRYSSGWADEVFVSLAKLHTLPVVAEVVAV
jgi:hypothetical protein